MLVAAVPPESISVPTMTPPRQPSQEARAVCKAESKQPPHEPRESGAHEHLHAEHPEQEGYRCARSCTCGDGHQPRTPKPLTRNRTPEPPNPETLDQKPRVRNRELDAGLLVSQHPCIGMQGCLCYLMRVLMLLGLCSWGG